MLSSQTKDEVTAKAMAKLQKYGLTVEKVMKAKQEKIKELIHPVGFANVILAQAEF